MQRSSIKVEVLWPRYLWKRKRQWVIDIPIELFYWCCMEWNVCVTKSRGLMGEIDPQFVRNEDILIK